MTVTAWALNDGEGAMLHVSKTQKSQPYTLLSWSNGLAWWDYIHTSIICLPYRAILFTLNGLPLFCNFIVQCSSGRFCKSKSFKSLVTRQEIAVNPVYSYCILNDISKWSLPYQLLDQYDCHTLIWLPCYDGSQLADGGRDANEDRGVELFLTYRHKIL